MTATVAPPPKNSEGCMKLYIFIQILNFPMNGQWMYKSEQTFNDKEHMEASTGISPGKN